MTITLRRTLRSLLFVLVLLGSVVGPGLTDQGSAQAGMLSFIYTGLFGGAGTQSPSAALDKTLIEPCVFCEFSGALIAASDSFAYNAFSAVQEPVSKIVNYMFALWIILQGALLMLGMGPGSNPGAIIWNLITRSCMFFIIIGLLAVSGPKAGLTSSAYWDTFYKLPITEAINGANLIASKSGGGVLDGSCGVTLKSGSKLEKLDQSTLIKIMCLVEKVEKNNRLGMAFGWQVFGNFNGGTLELKTYLNGAASLLVGLAIIIAFAASSIYFAFFVVDLFVRIAFVTAFAPFFIGFFLFKPTRQFSLTAINSVVSSLFTLMGIAAVYGFSAGLIKQIPAIYWGTVGQSGGSGTDFGAMLNHINNNPVQILSGYVWFAIIAAITNIALASKLAGVVGGIFGGGGQGGGFAEKAMGGVKGALGAAAGIAGAVGGGAMFLGGGAALKGAAKVWQGGMAAGGAVASAATSGGAGQAMQAGRASIRSAATRIMGGSPPPPPPGT